MMRPLIVLILASSLAGCSTLLESAIGLFSPASKGLSVDAEMTIGDKTEEIATGAVVGNKEEVHNTADVLTQTYKTVNEAAPWWVIALLILGWVLPEPSRMGSWIMKTIKGGRHDD